MPTPKKGARLGGSPAHQKLILSNMAKQLITHRSLKTTEAKAKMLQPLMEKMITKAKRGDIHARRTVSRRITDRDAVYALFDEIVPAMDPERNGGYTRIVKLAPRRGDNAPMVQIALVMEKVEKKAVVSAAEKTVKKAAAKATIEEPEAPEVEEKVAADGAEAVEAVDTVEAEATEGTEAAGESAK